VTSRLRPLKNVQTPITGEDVRSWSLDIFAAEPMLSSEVEAWIAAQRPNKLAQAAVAEAMAAWAILLDRSAVIRRVRDRFSGNPTLLCRDAHFRFMTIISW